jgi:hypothetical protein
LNEFKAKLLEDINRLTNKWVGDRNTQFVCSGATNSDYKYSSGSTCRLSFIGGSGLSLADAHALAATLNARSRSLPVDGTLYTYGRAAVSGTDTPAPTFSRYHHQASPKGKAGGHAGQPPSSSSWVQMPKGMGGGMGRKKKGKVSKASTGVDPQPASDSQGHADATTTAIVTAGVLVAVLVAVIGALLWQQKAAASPDRQQRTDSPRAEALSVDEMWEAPAEVNKSAAGQYTDVSAEQ